MHDLMFRVRFSFLKVARSCNCTPTLPKHTAQYKTNTYILHNQTTNLEHTIINNNIQNIMLSHKAALGGIPVAIRQAASRHIPVSSLAFTRIASMNNYNKSTPTSSSSPQIVRFLHNTTLNQSPPVSYPSELTRRWKSAHPICENIDTNIAKDLSPEDFDSE